MNDVQRWVTKIGDDEALGWLLETLTVDDDPPAEFDMNVWMFEVDRAGNRLRFEHEFVPEERAEVALDAFVRALRKEIGD